jgi:hypothetical protein
VTSPPGSSSGSTDGETGSQTGEPDSSRTEGEDPRRDARTLRDVPSLSCLDRRLRAFTSAPRSEAETQKSEISYCTKKRVSEAERWRIQDSGQKVRLKVSGWALGAVAMPPGRPYA